jgi:hypothetical protein
MSQVDIHPYTQAVIDAWRRLSGASLEGAEPVPEQYPGLVSQLFVLNRAGESDYPFRRVGGSVEQLFGRALLEHNFLSLWSANDRALVAAALAAAVADRGPAIVRARGESLHGRRVELEFALAPLLIGSGEPDRFLGVMQTLTSEDVLSGRPLRRLQALAVFPPAPAPAHPILRIVSPA